LKVCCFGLALAENQLLSFRRRAKYLCAVFLAAINTKGFKQAALHDMHPNRINQYALQMCMMPVNM
jgi:hypothetical protein